MPGSIRPDLDVVEHRIDERRLDRDLLVVIGELVVVAERAEDAARLRFAVEPIEPEVVREECRDPRLEHVETRELVVADPENDVHLEARTRHELRQLAEQAALAPVVGVVEEELLDLIEDEAELAVERPGPALERDRRAFRARRPGRSRRSPPAPTVIASSSPATGSPDQVLEYATASGLLERELAAGDGRRRRASSELLPTPLGP